MSVNPEFYIDNGADDQQKVNECLNLNSIAFSPKPSEVKIRQNNRNMYNTQMTEYKITKQKKIPSFVTGTDDPLSQSIQEIIRSKNITAVEA